MKHSNKFLETIDLNFESYLVKTMLVFIAFAFLFELLYIKSFVKTFNSESIETSQEYHNDIQLDVPTLEESPVDTSEEVNKQDSSFDSTASVKKAEDKPQPDYKARAKSLGLPEDYDVEKAIQGMDYLVNEQDFSKEGAAGIIGNLFSESRFNGSEVYGSHTGIAQWDANRWPLIEDWLYVNNYKEHSFLGQLMAIFESEDGKHFQETFHAMREMSDAETAAQYWLERYEKAPGQAEAERQWIAQLTFELYNY